MPRQLRKPTYDVHPGVAMTARWIDSLKSKTGHTLEESIKLIQKKGPPTEKERHCWLKEEHGLGTNNAWLLAQRAGGGLWLEDTPDGYLQQATLYVEEMYAGAKAGLRPMHDRLIELPRRLVRDVKVCPCKTIVPFYRQHFFAQIKPTTRTWIDFGLALGDMKVPARLIDTGGLAKKDRITHRIPITALDEIDADVAHWLQVAYDRDA